MPYSSIIIIYNAYPKGANANVRKQPVTTSPVLVNVGSNKLIGKLTGNWENKTDGHWFEVTHASKGKGWIRQDVAIFKDQAGKIFNINFKTATDQTKDEKISDAEANKRLSQMFANDRFIFENIAKAGTTLQALKAKKVNTVAYENKLLSITQSYSKRQNEINKTKNLKTERNSLMGKVAEKASWLWSKVTSVFHGTENEDDELGVAFAALIPLIVPVIKFICVAVSAFLVYKALKPSYEQSGKDVRDIKELQEAISGLAPEEKKKVEQIVQKEIDNAYNDGKKNGSNSTFWGTAKNVGMVCIGVIVAKKFLFK